MAKARPGDSRVEQSVAHAGRHPTEILNPRFGDQLIVCVAGEGERLEAIPRVAINRSCGSGSRS
jgi:hypothetical protein